MLYNILQLQLVTYCSKLECFSLSVTFILVLYLLARLEPTQMESLTELQSKGWLLDLPANIRDLGSCDLE
jgi:hypothetical protein